MLQRTICSKIHGSDAFRVSRKKFGACFVFLTFLGLFLVFFVFQFFMLLQLFLPFCSLFPPPPSPAFFSPSVNLLVVVHVRAYIHARDTHVCSSVNPFTIWRPLPTLPSGNCQSVPRIYASISVDTFFVTLLCSLDSTYKRDHVVFVFPWLCLWYFT